MKLRSLVAVLAAFYSVSSFADSACIDHSWEADNHLRVALGEQHSKMIEVDSIAVGANVEASASSPALQSALESGQVEVSVSAFPAGQGSSVLMVTASASHGSPSLHGKLEVQVFDGSRNGGEVLELNFEVAPVLVMQFGYDEETSEVVWHTPQDLQLPTHEQGLMVCFEMLTLPPTDYRVHVQGAREVLPHQPRDWMLTEPGSDVGTYYHKVDTRETVTVEYREHYTESSAQLRQLTFNSNE
ncbi:MAG: hypothetical protein HRT45_03895 [Bdellovibrionales bacterium]|nr:hypothetical protein [Bdellovibrionales bacterium]